jgi:hypothetical protein
MKTKLEHRLTEMEQLAQISVRDLNEALEKARVAVVRVDDVIAQLQLIKGEIQEARRIVGDSVKPEEQKGEQEHE